MAKKGQLNVVITVFKKGADYGGYYYGLKGAD